MGTQIIKLKDDIVFILLCISCLISGLNAIRCLNEDGKEVDWFVVYKIPKLAHPFDTGRSYAFLTSNDTDTEKWRLSPYQANEKNSIFSRTLNQIYLNHERYTYVQYNDEAPESSRASSGGAHAKGVLALDENEGFWLIHSIPKFPPDFRKSYEFPQNGDVYGQTAICISLSTQKESEAVVSQLLVMRPSVYASNQADDVSVLNLDQLVSRRWSDDPRKTTQIDSLGGRQFYSIVKSPLAKFELYTEVAPFLQVDLLVESWRNGNGGKLDSQCQTKFKVNNIEEVQLKLDTSSTPASSFSLSKTENGFFEKFIYKFTRLWRKNESTSLKSADKVTWNYHQDHSKWAISIESDKPFVCIGDMNRMRSQAKRGGGVICLKDDKQLWNNFKNSIYSFEPCPRNVTYS